MSEQTTSGYNRYITFTDPANNFHVCANARLSETAKVSVTLKFFKEDRAEITELEKKIENLAVTDGKIDCVFHITDILQEHSGINPDLIAHVTGTITVEDDDAQNGYPTQEVKVVWQNLIHNTWDKADIYDKLNKIATGMDTATVFKKQADATPNATPANPETQNQNNATQNNSDVNASTSTETNTTSIPERNNGADANASTPPNNSAATTATQTSAENDADCVKVIKENLVTLDVLAKTQADKDNKDGKEIYGDNTHKAVLLFQKEYKKQANSPERHTFDRQNLGKDGRVGRQTLLALDEALVNGWRYKGLLHESWRDHETLNKIAKEINDSKKWFSYKLDKKPTNGATDNRPRVNVESINIIQKNLTEKLDFLMAGKADGDYGKKTRLAVYLFQKYYKNKQVPEGYTKRIADIGKLDGAAGSNTLLAMDEALMEGWKYDDSTDTKLKEKIDVTEELVRETLGKMGFNTAKDNADLVKALKQSCETYEINTYLRLAHFLAQVGQESSFTDFEEIGDYSKSFCQDSKSWKSKYDALSETKRKDMFSTSKTKPERVKGILNYFYASVNGNGNEASGDGYRYRGRGLIQITGKSNYQKYIAIHNRNNPTDLITDFTIKSNPDNDTVNPTKLAKLEYAVDSAAIYWSKWETNSPNLNEYANLSKSDDLALIVGALVNGFRIEENQYMPNEPHGHTTNKGTGRLDKFKLAIAYFEEKIAKSNTPAQTVTIGSGGDRNATADANRTITDINASGQGVLDVNSSLL